MNVQGRDCEHPGWNGLSNFYCHRCGCTVQMHSFTVTQPRESFTATIWPSPERLSAAEVADQLLFPAKSQLEWMIEKMPPAMRAEFDLWLRDEFLPMLEEES